MDSDKINMSLDDIIKMTKKRSSSTFDDGDRKRARRSAPYPKQNSRPAPAFKRRSGNDQPNFRRSAPLNRSPEPDVWRHDLFQDDTRAPPQRRTERPSKGSSAVLKVSNLHYNVSEDDIRQLFEDFGVVLKSTLHYDRAGRSLGTAEVEYGSREEAVNAMKKYNNVLLDGQPMEIVMGDNGPSASNLASRLGNRPTVDFGSRPTMDFNSRSSFKFDNRPNRGFGGRPARQNNGPREQRRGGPAREKRQDMTKEQLDAELDDYLSKGMETDEMMS